MRGQILQYDPLTAEGLISGEDGNRYPFKGSEWKSALQALRTGSHVDFSVAGETAEAVFAISGITAGAGSYQQYDKSPVAAGLLALFLGGLGVHKFYLGYATEGVILLIGTLVSWATIIIGIGFLGLMAIGVICLIEGIIYLTKTPDEFNQTYVNGRKPWF